MGRRDAMDYRFSLNVALGFLKSGSSRQSTF